MTRIPSIIIALFCCLGATAASAQSAAEKILPVDGQISADGSAIELSWFDAKPPRVGSVTVKRRFYGQTGGHTWQVIADALGPVMRYRDETVRAGTAYEYQVLRTAQDIVDVGYWLAGTEIPAKAQRGHAYVIVDEVIAEAIAPRLERFRWDLIGDGWQVQRYDVPRHDGLKMQENLKHALNIKKWLRAGYNADPFGHHNIILVGHVPIILSGRVAPDGHGVRPHPTDVFYADMDGRWSMTREGEVLDNQVPGDFIEMQLGRIDFAPLGTVNQDNEIRLLRAYFDKNHHWRMSYHGDLREAYGKAEEHLGVEQIALRNIVGATNVTRGGHHDVGEEKPWIWGVDFGDYDGSKYTESYANKAIFALNFGSGKQEFSRTSNAMTASLAQPFYTVAVGWGARPAWWLHHMALGGSIGEVHMRTVNNGRAKEPYRDSMDYFPPGNYMMRNGIWVNLLGDPTLRAFPLAPPGKLAVTLVTEGAKLSWQPSPDADTLGYQVFRARADGAIFSLLSGPDPVADTEYTDTNPPENPRYMVRAYGLKDVHAGSFYALSQGVFASETPFSYTKMDIFTPTGKSIRMPDIFTNTVSGVVRSIISAPARGQLTQTDTGWLYTPPIGFTGVVDLQFSISDGMRRAKGILRINVTP